MRIDEAVKAWRARAYTGRLYRAADVADFCSGPEPVRYFTAKIQDGYIKVKTFDLGKKPIEGLHLASVCDASAEDWGVLSPMEESKGGN